MDSSTSNSTSIAETKATATYYVTTVHGRKETGLTVVDRTGQGTFFPDDETALPERGYVNASQSKIRDDHQEKESLSLEALYPQWEDGQAEIGIAVRKVSNAFNDLEKLLEPCTTDTESLNYIILAETQLFQALPKARFNRAFEIVVSFCAWSVRNIEFSLPHGLPLQALCSALRELSENPFLSIDRSAILITNLEKLGWSGESPVSRSFEEGLAAIFDEEQAELL